MMTVGRRCIAALVVTAVFGIGTAVGVAPSAFASARYLHSVKFPACPSPAILNRVLGGQWVHNPSASGGGTCSYLQQVLPGNPALPDNVSYEFTEQKSSKSKFKSVAVKRYGVPVTKIPGVGQGAYQAIFPKTPGMSLYVLAKNGKILGVDVIGTPANTTGEAAQQVALARAELGK
jgi:hypothetical protein